MKLCKMLYDNASQTPDDVPKDKDNDDFVDAEVVD